MTGCKESENNMGGMELAYLKILSQHLTEGLRKIIKTTYKSQSPGKD
jgi:hypothetical protein